MARFRKKPVVIEAVQYTGDNFDEVLAHGFPQPILTDENDALLIKTLEGVMRADVGDWVIKGVKDEFYPCKPDIFAATYGPVSTDGQEGIELRPEVRTFAEAMETQLRKHDGEWGQSWKEIPPDEDNRLEGAQDRHYAESARRFWYHGRTGTDEGVLLGAADVANFLMMRCDIRGLLPVADVCGALGEERTGDEV